MSLYRGSLRTDRPNVPIKIVEKINGEIQGGLGGLDIGDPELYAGQTLIQDMNEGKIFRVETSGDGLRNVQLRIVEATEPLLSRSEMRHVKTASETAIINLKSGNIAIASQDQLADMDWKYRISHQVSPGHYKVCVYHKGDVLYVVLCKTSLEAKNNFYRFFIFEEY